MIGGSKKHDEESRDTDSQMSEHRADGRDAQVFTVSGAAGYIPHHKEPPRYIKFRAHNKKNRDFNRVFLAQELAGTTPPPPRGQNKAATNGVESNFPVTTAPLRRSSPRTAGAIWSMEFSKDGKYLAAAGKDHVVRVWAVISTPEERRAHEEEEIASRGGEGERLSAPVFSTKPVRGFSGHTGEVLDLSWSKNNFLLSSSMDKTVRLWHISRKDCLCTFAHPDFVTSISFHPTDDRFFLAGSLDSLLRFWSIPDRSVPYSAKLNDLITAVGFSPDGKTSIAGVLNGQCYFYDTEGLKLQTQIHVRSSRGKNSKGSKITGISTITILPSRGPPLSTETVPELETSTVIGRRTGSVKVLITSNDSRIRVYNLEDKMLEAKYKGHENASSQISASFSDDAQYVICGSEDRRTFIWDTATTESGNKHPAESFEGHNVIVTAAIFAPTKTRQLLGGGGDPIYDLCNPPPVMLLSRDECASLSEDQHTSSDVVPPAIKKPEESPGYILRSTHYDGNIIVTADRSGIIKVFRQDCAWSKRRHENWDTGSLSRRRTQAVSTNRTASVPTRASGSHSRAGSLSQVHRIVTPQGSSDRILSWRAGVGEGAQWPGTPSSTRTERSVSPPPRKTGQHELLNPSSGSNIGADAGKRYPAGKQGSGHRAEITSGNGMSQNPMTSARSMQSAFAGNAKIVGILKKQDAVEVDNSQTRTPGLGLNHKSMESDHPVAAGKKVIKREKDEDEKKPEKPERSERSERLDKVNKHETSAAVSNAVPTPSLGWAAGVSSLWGRWRGISSLAMRGGGTSAPRAAPADRASPIKSSTSKKDITAMDPANYDSDSGSESDFEDVRMVVTEPGRQKSPTEDGRRQNVGDGRRGRSREAEKPQSDQLKQTRRKSVGFINVKPEEDGSDDGAAEHDMFAEHNTRSLSRSMREGEKSRASRERHSAPPLVLRRNLEAVDARRIKASQARSSVAYSHVPTTSRESPAREGNQRDSVVSTPGTSTVSQNACEGEGMKCPSCGGKKFKAKTVQVATSSAKKQRFLCGKCGTLVREVG